jgi:hypothetical protein
VANGKTKTKGKAAARRARKNGPSDSQGSRRHGDAQPQAARGLRDLSTPGSKLLLFCAFAVVGLVIYGPALDGAFISDDEHYVQRNVYVHAPLDNLVAILDPTSVLAVVVENYAPVHVLLHALEWQFFETDVRGYHVVNVLFHALASLLIVLLFRRSGITPVAATLGGLFFWCTPGTSRRSRG